MTQGEKENQSEEVLIPAESPESIEVNIAVDERDFSIQILTVEATPINDNKGSSPNLPLPSKEESSDISGIVVDDKGLPISNLLVRVVGSRASTSTNENGAFTLSSIVKNRRISLRFSNGKDGGGLTLSNLPKGALSIQLTIQIQFMAQSGGSKTASNNLNARVTTSDIRKKS